METQGAVTRHSKVLFVTQSFAPSPGTVCLASQQFGTFSGSAGSTQRLQGTVPGLLGGLCDHPRPCSLFQRRTWARTWLLHHPRATCVNVNDPRANSGQSDSTQSWFAAEAGGSHHKACGCVFCCRAYAEPLDLAAKSSGLVSCKQDVLRAQGWRAIFEMWVQPKPIEMLGRPSGRIPRCERAATPGFRDHVGL